MNVFNQFIGQLIYQLHRKAGLNDNDLYPNTIYSQSYYLESICHNSFTKFILYYSFPFSNYVTIL